MREDQRRLCEDVRALRAQQGMLRVTNCANILKLIAFSKVLGGTGLGVRNKEGVRPKFGIFCLLVRRKY